LSGNSEKPHFDIKTKYGTIRARRARCERCHRITDRRTVKVLDWKNYRFSQWLCDKCFIEVYGNDD